MYSRRRSVVKSRHSADKPGKRAKTIVLVLYWHTVSSFECGCGASLSLSHLDSSSSANYKRRTIDPTLLLLLQHEAENRRGSSRPGGRTTLSNYYSSIVPLLCGTIVLVLLPLFCTRSKHTNTVNPSSFSLDCLALWNRLLLLE